MIEAFRHIIDGNAASHFPALVFAFMVAWLASKESQRSHRFLSGFRTGLVYFCIPWVGLCAALLAASLFVTGRVPSSLNALFLVWFFLGLAAAAIGAGLGQRTAQRML